MLWYLQLFDGIFVTDNTVMLFKELKVFLIAGNILNDYTKSFCSSSA